MSEAVAIAFFRSGQCRNDEHALSHTYAEMEDGELYPMCGFGWNRANGHRLSIFRGSPGTQGACKQCAKNIRLGKPPIMEGWEHKTKWL